jgi:hypothetical protein
METMTTSPVESMNELIKHGPQGVDSNMNLRKSVQTMTNTIYERFEDHRKNTLREMNVINRASQSNTKRNVERKAQYLFDILFDNRLSIKCAQLSAEQWLAFNFDINIEEECRRGPWPRLPRFHNVFFLIVKRRGEHLFLWCSCRHFDE